MEIAMSVEWLERIERKIDAQGRQLEAQSDRLDVMDTRFDGIGTRFDGIDRRLDGIDTRLDGIDGRLDGIDRQLEAHGARLDRHEQLLETNGKELFRVGVLVEKLQDDIRGVAEGVMGVSERMDRAFNEVLARLDERAAPIEAASRHFASKLADHERRLPKRPRRRRR
jgi:chromosome segregation ATPase